MRVKAKMASGISQSSPPIVSLHRPLPHHTAPGMLTSQDTARIPNNARIGLDGGSQNANSPPQASSSQERDIG